MSSDPFLPDDLLYYTRCPAPTATGVAVGLGLLAPVIETEHRIHLEALQDVTAEAFRIRHFDHGIVNLVREGGNIPALWAYSSGAPTRLIGITWLDEYQAIVSAPGSQIQSVADLVGARIPAPARRETGVDVGRASMLRGFERALSVVGLDLTAVEIVDTPSRVLRGPGSNTQGESFTDQLDFLANGQVDAVWLKGANGVAEVRRRGLREVLRIDLHPDPLVRVNNGTPRTITARQELIDERPELVQTYLRVLQGAATGTNGDRRRLWEVLSAETHESVDDAEIAYERVAPDSLVPSLDSLRVEALQQQADFLFAEGFIPNPFDVASWSLDVLASETLESPRPKADTRV